MNIWKKAGDGKIWNRQSCQDGSYFLKIYYQGSPEKIYRAVMSKIEESKENTEMDNYTKQDDDKTVTLKQFLDEQRQMEIAAAEALPYKFDECTWKLGPIRQNLHICTTCPNLETEPDNAKAFCYSCAVSCHNFNPEDEETVVSSGLKHSIEEIWTRRNFRCDCPSTGHCRLVPPEEIAQDLFSHQNSYHHVHNFKGQYCFCNGSGWAAGDQTMYQCEICEDWYHDTCVVEKADLSSEHIPSEDSFEDFVCCDCVKEKVDFFTSLQLNEFIFTFSRAEKIEFPNSLFLKPDWRQNIQKQLENVPSLRTKASSLSIEHFIASEEEAVFNPEEDSDAVQSIYDRKNTLFSS